ncbi:DICT sensory domain-containing protein [Natronococcus jeotgali]|uniref:Sensor protein n=1 Tax=Natronococcus jeotgali DSM 18795 TaxID=1227498 RepID=L9XR70_9EURY|nr:DICT sensory domain-containing protein [Natronococcus jeotgali]ELY64314.1 sensor protein [Natronococcus jeotgali DSM 18795]
MTVETLGEALEAVERERKRLEVYAADDGVAADLERQFATRNVDVEYRRAAAFEEGFVVIRGPSGEFRGALGLEEFDAVLSPEIHPPWTLEGNAPDARELFDFLENTLFAAYDRRQMLAAAREIEERAWRTAAGRLYAGFQREAAFDDQRAVYDRLASRGALSVTAFVDEAWDGTKGSDGDPPLVSGSGELGRFWFVAFDGGGDVGRTCALVAEERRPDRYYGFWTYDPVLVDELFAHLETSYDVPTA